MCTFVASRNRFIHRHIKQPQMSLFQHWMLLFLVSLCAVVCSLSAIPFHRAAHKSCHTSLIEQINSILSVLFAKLSRRCSSSIKELNFLLRRFYKFATWKAAFNILYDASCLPSLTNIITFVLIKEYMTKRLLHI